MMYFTRGLFVFLLYAVSYPSFSGAPPVAQLTILTTALGKEGEKFPVELSKFWQPVTISQDSKDVDIAANIKLIRIDLTEEKEFSLPSANSWIDKLVKPDPRVVLKKMFDGLQQAKISKEFSDALPSDKNQLQAHKEKYVAESTVFEIVNTGSLLADNQAATINELLPKFKKRLEQDIVAGVTPLKYVVLYNLSPAAVVISPIASKPAAKENSKPQKIAESATSCAISPISMPTKPNWYAVVEIGSKGIKPIAVQLANNKGKLEPTDFKMLDTQDVTPREEVSISRVVQSVCDDINQFHTLYGNLPIYIVGSSGIADLPHRAKLEAAVTAATHLSMDFITAYQEASFLARGIWVPPLPAFRRCESIVVDIGSGNVKGGYLENCNPKKEGDPKEQFASFDIPDVGTAAFSSYTQQNIDNKTFATFVDSAKSTREELEVKLDEQIRTRPELTNGKKRFYFAGGAVWMMNTLLCLDCPQYEKRSETGSQSEYTVMKPSDIDEFYRYVTEEGDKICDISQENPYLKKDMDGKYGKPWNEARIEKQRNAIMSVCKKFKAPRDMISAAEILRAIKNKMELNESSHLFFMQNNLYTWSRQYLIDTISVGSHTK
jgi:hypothetical protein